MPVDRRITRLLADWRRSREGALEELLPLVVADLRKLAGHYLAAESPAHTLQPTALVNEVYLRLAGRQVQRFDGRSEFFAFAARLMREILIDHARARSAAKRGGSTVRPVPLDGIDLAEAGIAFDPSLLLSLHESLERLGAVDPQKRRIVELRYFVGLTVPEIATVLEMGRSTVERHWTVAKLWLAREMRGEGPSHPA